MLRHGHVMNEEAFEQSSAVCSACKKKFSLLVRKHNCRVCGVTFCSTCAPKVAILEGADDDLMRVCKPCAIRVTKEQRAEADLEKEKLRKVKKVLEAKEKGIEAKKKPDVEVDSDAVMQLQQKMKMQQQVQQHSKHEPVQSKEEIVLEPLPVDWASREYRVVCLSESRWAPDDSASKCSACSNEFTNQLRRHHCRACGNVCCSACVPFVGLAIDPARMGEAEEFVRVCGKCVQKTLAVQKKALLAKGEKKARVLAEKLAAEKASSS